MHNYISSSTEAEFKSMLQWESTIICVQITNIVGKTPPVPKAGILDSGLNNWCSRLFELCFSFQTVLVCPMKSMGYTDGINWEVKTDDHGF
jgi:hypothetical protein